jgi:haloalkane dehalogenase
MTYSRPGEPTDEAIEYSSPASPDSLDRTFPNSRGVRRVPGAKLFFPEESPDLLAEEARRLWGV